MLAVWEAAKDTEAGIHGRIRSTVSQQCDIALLSSWAYLQNADNCASLDGLLEFEVAMIRGWHAGICIAAAASRPWCSFRGGR